MLANSQSHLYEFGPFELSATEAVLRREGQVVPLAPKSLDLLLALVQSGGRVLSTQELLDTVWAGVTVDKSNLPTQVGLLRRALGDGFIETAPKRGYRFTAEVTERWEAAGAPNGNGAAEPAGVDAPKNAANASTSALPLTRSRARWYAWAAVAAVVGLAALGLSVLHHHQRRTQATVSAGKGGRYFARATSEGGGVRVVRLDRQPQELFMAPDGRKLYSVDESSKTLTVLDGTTYAVRKVISLPTVARCATMTRDGTRIYLGSGVDGVMAVDTGEDRVVGQTVPIGGPMSGLAVTPDGKKLFAAVLAAGVKVIDVAAGESRLLSGIACPISVGIDPEGRELYVSYQCGGAGGREGHDAVEVYDVETERPVATISGPPMVSGIVSFVPDGRWALLPGSDACRVQDYDHVGCPFVPSSVYHLVRTADHKVVNTIARPGNAGRSTFTPDGTRIVLAGDSLTSMDPMKARVAERFARPGEFYRQVVFTPAGDRLIVPVEPAGLLVFDLLDAACLPPTNGLQNLYSGDGTLDDDREVNSLVAEGGVEYAPGLIGQAFQFNGRDGFLRVRSFGACGGCVDPRSASLFVKFNELTGEMNLLERLRGGEEPALRLFKSADDRIVLEGGERGERGPSVSTSTPVNAGVWHHLAVVTNKDERALYVDGQRIGHIVSPRVPLPAHDTFLGAEYMGAAQDRSRFFSGLMDEIAFYNRALSEGEIKSLYEMSVNRPCGLGRTQ